MNDSMSGSGSGGKLRVVVTGATGFLGGRVLEALAADPRVEPIAACRTPARLAASFGGAVRVGDLEDAAYRRELCAGTDVVCHTATPASMWGHARLERRRFFEPTLDLVEQSIRAGVKRFVQTSTVAVAANRGDAPLDDFAPMRPTGFWPHLDRLIDLDRAMQANSRRGTQMVTLRLGHFVGRGNRLGMFPALVPRLRTRLVPWLAGGHKHLPLVADADLGRAFLLAAVAPRLDDYESFNICGAEFPTLRQVIELIAAETGFAKPLFSVPYAVAYVFGAAMEKLAWLLPGSSPFLTRSIVHLAESWVCSGERARIKLGYEPRKAWQVAAREYLAELRSEGYGWPRLAQF